MPRATNVSPAGGFSLGDRAPGIGSSPAQTPRAETSGIAGSDPQRPRSGRSPAQSPRTETSGVAKPDSHGPHSSPSPARSPRTETRGIARPDPQCPRSGALAAPRAPPSNVSVARTSASNEPMPLSRSRGDLPLETRSATSHGLKVLAAVHQAQQRLDRVLQLAETGRTFSPAELLALQAHTYRATQELDLAGKVLEKGVSGIKQLLQTQV